MTDLFLGLSATAQFLFAISAIPFWLHSRSDHQFRFGLFEWTWFIAEVLMIVGSTGLGRFDLLPGLIINFIFLSLCLWHDLSNRKRAKENEQMVDDVVGILKGAGIEVMTFDEMIDKMQKETLRAQGKHVQLVDEPKKGDPH